MSAVSHARELVMVVDEDLGRGVLVSNYLRGVGYESLPVANGKQAMEMLLKGPRPAAVVCSEQLLDDRFAAAALSKEAKVLLMTDRGPDAERPGAIRRPFHLVDLGAKLFLLLRGRRGP
jgi:CheY-like chemotaxis protein